MAALSHEQIQAVASTTAQNRPSLSSLFSTLATGLKQVGDVYVTAKDADTRARIAKDQGRAQVEAARYGAPSYAAGQQPYAAVSGGFNINSIPPVYLALGGGALLLLLMSKKK